MEEPTATDGVGGVTLAACSGLAADVFISVCFSRSSFTSTQVVARVGRRFASPSCNDHWLKLRSNFCHHVVEKKNADAAAASVCGLPSGYHSFSRARSTTTRASDPRGHSSTSVSPVLMLINGDRDRLFGRSLVSRHIRPGNGPSSVRVGDCCGHLRAGRPRKYLSFHWFCSLFFYPHVLTKRA